MRLPAVGVGEEPGFGFCSRVLRNGKIPSLSLHRELGITAFGQENQVMVQCHCSKITFLCCVFCWHVCRFRGGSHSQPHNGGYFSFQMIKQ